jgi:hypothetical protein
VPPDRHHAGSHRAWRPLPALAALVGVLGAAGCIEDRITIDLLTQIQADGSCTRRVVYRVERVDSEKGGARVAIPPAQDPLRSFRIPAGEPWHVQEQAQTGLHEITVEASLPSASAIEGDWSRLRSAKAQPARNAVSAFCDPESGSYEYVEVLHDPASPLAGARLLSRLAVQSDGLFADRFSAAYAGGAPPRAGELRRLYRGVLAEPFAREVARLAERPFYGPRERGELRTVLAALEAKQARLGSGIGLLLPGTPAAEIEAATGQAMNELGETIARQVQEAGLPLASPEGSEAVRFHARLVMPAPIQRANTCFNGDSAEWDFDEGDLFGRGFEMRASAGRR